MIDPRFIQEHIDRFTKNEASKILREWIENSNNQDLRKEAMDLLCSIDDGSNFEFYEQLFISEENQAIRDLAGKMIRQNYFHHENLLSLLEFTLRKIKNFDQKFFALEVLNSSNSQKALKIIKSYVKSLSQMKDLRKESDLFEDLESSIIDKHVNSKYLEKIFNLILFEFYTKYCKYHVAIRDGYIILLNCEGANISHVYELQGLPKLRYLEHLILKRNQLIEVNDIEFLMNLKILDLSYNTISIVHPLNSLKSLMVLNLEGNHINELKEMIDLPYLEKLYLGSNNLQELKNLENLKKLRVLNLDRNKIRKIENLDNFNDLEQLNLASNNIEKIEGLQHNQKLLSLYLNDNSIIKIEGLENLTKLKILNLSNNYIVKIENLESLRNLIKLEISNNKVEKIEGLDSLVNLQELFLDRNYIERFEGLKELVSLIILFLDSNNISEFNADLIQSLTNLNFIFMNDNPLSPESRNAYNKKCRFP